MKDFDSIVTIIILSVLCGLYTYLLLSPTQPRLSNRDRNFIIRKDTQANFDEFMGEVRDYQKEQYGWYNPGSGSSIDKKDFTVREDDFFMDSSMVKGQEFDSRPYEPIVPSLNYICKPGSWITMKSDLNYKYLWMHAAENKFMGATATVDTPLHRKSFKMILANSTCEDGGWTVLQEGDSDGFIYMVPPSNGAVDDEWTVKIGTKDVEEAKRDARYRFLLEKEGYALNEGSFAFINVMSTNEYTVRGHSSGWDKDRAAVREYGALLDFEIVDDKRVQEALDKELKEENEDAEQDKKYIAQIASFPTSTEKRIISFGLYGSKPKYTTGAIKNAELVKVYFPGWICRFYVTSDVPNEVLKKLKELGSEISNIPDGMGYISGMFWRFHIADDPSVDRYIIRDSDSRLNARDRYKLKLLICVFNTIYFYYLSRLAVEEWIESKYPVHVMRDHVNHCIVMNGGMWGGVKGAVKGIKEKIETWTNKDSYAADLSFLEDQIWPDIRDVSDFHLINSPY